MKHSLRRGVVATAVAALGAGLLVAAPAAQAATPSGSAAADWLATQLHDGIAEQGGYQDYGLTIDVFFALKDLGVRADTQGTIIAALSQKVDDYTTSGEYGPDDRWAGASGKLASAVQAAGGDARDVGGVDVVQRAEDRVATTGPSTGRATDLSSYGEYSNTIGQAWVVRALTTARTARSASTVGYLLAQQCDGGGFRLKMADVPCATPAEGNLPTADSTALALQALVTARANGVRGLDDDIADAVQWLTTAQQADGSFTDGTVSNTNSTGLAAAVLERVARPEAADRAARWIAGRQAGASVPESSALRSDLGAVALDPTAYDAGVRDGITAQTRDQWVRATAQAAAGLDAQLSSATFGVTAPAGYVASGRTFEVRSTGHAPGETLRVRVAGGGTYTSKARPDGTATTLLRAPSTSGTVRLAMTGARSDRVGTASVRVVLAAKTLAASVSRTKVARGGQVRVWAKGLAAGEPVRVYYRSRYVATGRATSTGTYTTVIGVGPITGAKTVYVRGLTDRRQGTAGLTVVR